MKEYFNLNDRARKAWNNNGGKAVLSGLVLPDEYNHSERDSVTQDFPDTVTLANQIFMYLGTFIGVLLSTAVTHFRHGNLNLTVTLGEIVLSAVVALVIVPVVYEKLNLHPGTPFIVQFGIFVQNGVFWHILIGSVGSIL